MDIRFVINKDTLEDVLIGDDYETIGRQMEGEKIGPHRIAHMAARFMVDAEGNLMPHPEALRTLGKLPGKQYRDALRQFSEAITEAMVPNPNGAASSSLSPANTPKTATPPDGSQP
jgi:hypothetical protein